MQSSDITSGSIRHMLAVWHIGGLSPLLMQDVRVGRHGDQRQLGEGAVCEGG